MLTARLRQAGEGTPLHRLLACMVVATAAATASAQSPVPAERIPEVLAGDWGMLQRDFPWSKPALRCDRGATRIRFERSGGDLTYTAVPVLTAPLPAGAVIVPARSKVKIVKTVPGFGMGGIEIQYDDETRLDASGKPVVWILVMPDSDTFYWHRKDWKPGFTTAASKRCPDSEKIG